MVAAAWLAAPVKGVTLEVGVVPVPVADATPLVMVTVEDTVEEMRPGRVPTVVVATAVVSGAALDETSTVDDGTVVVSTVVLATGDEDGATEVVAGAAEDEEES